MRGAGLFSIPSATFLVAGSLEGAGAQQRRHGALAQPTTLVTVFPSTYSVCQQRGDHAFGEHQLRVMEVLFCAGNRVRWSYLPLASHGRPVATNPLQVVAWRRGVAPAAGSWQCVGVSRTRRVHSGRAWLFLSSRYRVCERASVLQKVSTRRRR